MDGKKWFSAKMTWRGVECCGGVLSLEVEWLYEVEGRRVAFRVAGKTTEALGQEPFNINGSQCLSMPRPIVSYTRLPFLFTRCFSFQSPIATKARP